MEKQKRKSDLTHCEFDAKNHHYWQIEGVDGVFFYYRCSQCRKWRREKISYVKGGKRGC